MFLANSDESSNILWERNQLINSWINLFSFPSLQVKIIFQLQFSNENHLSTWMNEHFEVKFLYKKIENCVIYVINSAAWKLKI